MLLIEGPDGIGKTTLAKKIVRKLSSCGVPVVYSWMTRPNEDKFDFFNSYREMINPYAVQDRFHLSGMAYHNNKVSPRNTQIINSWIRSQGGLIVVLYADDTAWYHKYISQTKNQDVVSVDLMCQANIRYRNYAKYSDCDFSFNILPSFNITKPRFVCNFDIDEIMDEWISRRRDLGIGDI